MHNKTVAIVINTSWNIFNFRIGLLKALEEEGYQIIAIAPKDKYSFKLKEMGFKYYDIPINSKGTNPFEELKLLYAFYKLYKEIKPDIILHYTIKPNIYGSLAAKILGIPVIANISGLGTIFLNKHFSSKVGQVLYKIALTIPQKVFYQNRDDQELFIKNRLVTESRTDVLAGSGIDTEKFKPLDNKRESEVFRFLFIGRLIKDKGILEYVEAIRIILLDFKVEFHILGDFYRGNPTAITEDELKMWVKEGIIHYLGMSDDVKSVIDRYDCIVLPSYREGLSRVLLESASMATPIITTDVAGCKEVVDDGINGYLCKVKDVTSLVKQMKKMILLNNDERRVMGLKGREKVKNEFDEKLVIEKYKIAIENILT